MEILKNKQILIDFNEYGTLDIKNTLKEYLTNIIYNQLTIIENTNIKKENFKFAFNENSIYVAILFIDYTEVFQFTYNNGFLKCIDRWTY